MAIKVGENTQIKATQTIALDKARDYLRKQLMIPNPNIGTIYSTIKPIVDSHPILLQMVNNQIDLLRTAYVWPVLGGLTNVDKSRYVEAVKDVIALLA